MSASPVSVLASVPETKARARHPGSAPDTVPDTVSAIFFVTADAGPGIAPRLVGPFAKLGLVPARVHISSEDGSGEDISADLRLRNVTRETAQKIENALRSIVGVRQVIALVE